MEHNTQQFVRHIQTYIEGGHTGRALEILSNCLSKENLFFTEILTLQSEFNELRRREHLGLDSDKTRMRQIGYATAQYLGYIEKQYSSKIDLIALPPDLSLSRRSTNTPLKKRKSRSPKKPPLPVMAKNVVTQAKSSLKNFFMLVGVMVFIGGFVYLKYFKEGASDLRNSSSLLSLTSGNGLGNVIFLDQFEIFEEADAKRKYYNGKGLTTSMIKIPEGMAPFKLVILDNGILLKTMGTVKKICPTATFQDFSQYCRSTVFDKSLQCHQCSK